MTTRTNSADNWTAAVVHEICPICTNKINEQIILPQRLSKPIKDEIDSMHGKAIRMSSEPCTDCKEFVSNGFLAVIGIDPEKSMTNKQDQTVKLRDVYRTGLVWVKREVANYAFPSWVEKKRKEPFIFVVNEEFQHFMNQISHLKEGDPNKPENNEKSQSTEE